jgi:alpha-tubulin suppressor-like RCC1 family protein
MPTFYRVNSVYPTNPLVLTDTGYWSLTGNGTPTSPYNGNSINQFIQPSDAKVKFIVNANGFLYWNISVSSEFYFDFAYLSINGVQIFSISGSDNRTNSQFVSVNSIVEIIYHKDGSVNSGADTTTINSLYLIPSNSTGIIGNFDDLFVPADFFNSGNIFSWGLNEYGQLALADTINRDIPNSIYYGFYDWRKVSAGLNFSAAIKYDGLLYTWGNNTDGQLGNSVNGIENSSNVPFPITSLGFSCVDVSCGYKHMAIIKNDGTIWSWGNGEYGQLARGSNTNLSNVPIQVSGNPLFKKVFCGNDYTFGLSIYDGLFSWGRNDFGQLGDGTTTNKTSIGNIVQYDFKTVACGEFHTVGITLSNQLKATGKNDYGQLGRNNLTNSSSFVTIGSDSDWKQVSCNGNYSIAIKTNGTMWSWGSNYEGQLGVGVGIASTAKPMQVGTDINWKQVSCGKSCTVAVKTDGSIWSWGLNDNNQLGLGNSFDSIVYTPTQIGSNYDWKTSSVGDSNFYAIRYQNVYL